MNFMLIPNLFLGLLRVFYLYLNQRPFSNLAVKHFPKHIILEVEREYRHKNYFKLYQKASEDFISFNVYQVKEFTKIRNLGLIKLFYFFLANCRILNQIDNESLKLRYLFGNKPAAGFATYCYFCALFDEVNSINPSSIIFHGGAALAAKAARKQNLKTYWLSHGIISPIDSSENHAIPDSDVVYVYSEDEKKYLEKRSVNTEIRLYPIDKVKKRLNTVIVFLDGDKTKEEENILLGIISIFKSYEYKIIIKTHPTFLKLVEPNLYKNLRSKFGSSTFLTKDIDTEELLLEETPSFVITWLSTAACISLRAGIIPICIEENESFYKLRFYEPYPYKRRTLYWKEESSRLEKILLNKEDYQKNLNLLLSR